MPRAQGDITRLLDEIECGHSGAEDRLYALVYDELRRNASAILRRRIRLGQSGATLQTTDLVNEAYFLFKKQRTASKNHGHFYGIFTRCMCRALGDYCKARKAKKRGGEHVRVPLDPERDGHIALVEVDLILDAIDSLEHQYPSERTAPIGGELTSGSDASFSSKAVIASLRMVLGWNVEEIIDRVRLDPAQVQRDWVFARAFVRKYLTERKR